MEIIGILRALGSVAGITFILILASLIKKHLRHIIK